MRGPILLAWELGGGYGHVTTLARVAERLTARGYRVVAALKDISAAGGLAKLGVEILQAPARPASLPGRTMPNGPQSSATMGDILAGAGLGHQAILAPVLGAWAALLKSVNPSLLIADFAPGAALAARGRVPLALTGTGYSVPPSHMAGFPLLHSISPPVWREEQLVETINRVLSTINAPCLDRLPQIFEADATLVTCFPALDPYRRERRRPADGPLLDWLPDLRDPDARSIFVYLSPGTVPPRHLLEALGEHAPRLRMFAPTLAPHERRGLAQRGATLFEAAASPASELCNNRLVVHYGGAGLSSLALLAGVPQLTLSVDIEKELTGATIEELGAGKLVKIHDPAARVTAGLIDRLASDRALAAGAVSVAEGLRADFKGNPADRFVADCERLTA
jgi:UDP:flavonoid glycosyltransferase YjiC (YdhE family)